MKNAFAICLVLMLVITDNAQGQEIKDKLENALKQFNNAKEKLAETIKKGQISNEQTKLLAENAIDSYSQIYTLDNINSYIRACEMPNVDATYKDYVEKKLPEEIEKATKELESYVKALSEPETEQITEPKIKEALKQFNSVKEKLIGV